MYTLTRGPAKLATKAAVRGTSQQIEQFESREGIRDPSGQIVMSSPKAVFNGRQRHMPRGNAPPVSMPSNTPQQDATTPQHEENVKFVYDAWSKVLNEFKREGIGTVYYQEKEPVVNNNFEPVNLEEWMAARLLENIKQNS